MSRNVVYIKPAPQAGILIWSFVALWYVGIVLPLVGVWLFFKYTVLAVVWVVHQLHPVAVRAPRHHSPLERA